MGQTVIKFNLNLVNFRENFSQGLAHNTYLSLLGNYRLKI